MSNLKILRGRVKSIKSTQKITKAMQLVSASKLKKLKTNMAQPEYCLTLIEQIIQNIDIANLSTIEQKFFAQSKSSSDLHLLIAIGSAKGLCGSFNICLLKNIKAEIEIYKKNNQNFQLIIFGKKIYDALKKDYESNIILHLNYAGDNQDSAIHVQERIMQVFANEDVKEVKLLFNKYTNSISPVTISEMIIPLKIVDNKSLTNPKYETEGSGLLLSTLSLYLQSKINLAIAHSRATEEQSRMIAMDNATKNAQEIVAGLTLQLNRTRQAIITKELIEIISGASTL